MQVSVTSYTLLEAVCLCYCYLFLSEESTEQSEGPGS